MYREITLVGWCARRVPRTVALTVALLAVATVARGGPFVTFESGQVRPIALSPDGTRLFVVNTPDNHLEIFDVAPGGLTKSGTVQVGLEPVAVAARNDGEVWVVNHLSDSVSVVDVSSDPPRVTRTLLVGDEPRDIVFAGPGRNRAFITTAHRGQQRTDASLGGVPGAGDPQLTVASVGRADVWVFDATNLGAAFGGTPLRILTLFGDTPRALAVSNDGSTVYAAVFHSGNRTTTVNEAVVCNGGSAAGSCMLNGVSYPGGLPAPNTDSAGVLGPETGLIVKFNPAMGQWQDGLGRNWNNAVRFNLPDRDVFAIDANANPPAEITTFTTSGAGTGVGTILFNMAVNPVSGKVYVSNLDSQNHVRFEGSGTRGTTVQGHLGEARITVLDGTSVAPRHLNKHINYAVRPAPAGVKDHSLAMPLDMAVTSDGATLYVAAFGSSKIGVFNTGMLENNTFVPSSANHITVSGGGPSGLALDEANGRLYVLTRFDNSISVINTATNAEIDHLPLHNPEPPQVVTGRPFLYDAHFTSSNGEASCASCHIFGDFDSLAWDLGNPDDVVLNNPNPFKVVGPVGDPDFHPLKGPMTTQSLRGMANHGPMHWRGDRTGGNDVGGDALDENAAFLKFNPAFVGLIGRSSTLTAAEMQQFADFILQVTYPPNPIRNLDNSLGGLNGTPQLPGKDLTAGRNFYMNTTVDVVATCNGCHTLNPALGFFGGDGFSTFENETQHFKIAHLRNMYQKIGMFGLPNVAPFILAGDNGHKGDQVRGFGFLHDGSIDTVFRFLRAGVFSGFSSDTQRRNVEAFVLAVDSNLAPIVGQQITLTSTNSAAVTPRIDLLVARAAASECDVVVKGTVGGEPRGYYRLPDGTFQPDRVAETPLSDAALRALAATPGQELTYTCVPPGNGERIGVERDMDGYYDADELDAGTDPADPNSYPGGPTPTPTPSATPTPTSTPAVGNCAAPDPIDKPRFKVSRNTAPVGDEKLVVKGEWVVSNTSPPIDPLANGLRFRVDDELGNFVFERVIPGGAGEPGWRANTAGTAWKYKDRDGILAPGINKVTVTNRGGKYRVKIRGRESDFTVDAGDLPLQVTIVLGGDAAAAANQCGFVAFNPQGGGDPYCKMSSSGASVSCR